MPFIYTTLVTVLVLYLYAFTQGKVGWARAKFKVNAPSMDGPEEFQRYIRVQTNFVENLIMFIPALWMFSLAWGDIWAALVGLVFFAGRFLYTVTYYKDPAKRGPGFAISWLATHFLLIGSVLWALTQIFITPGGA